MSRYSLREIAEKLTGSMDLDGALEALLLYLRALHSGWHPSLALYDPEHDGFDSLACVVHGRYERHALQFRAEQLPARLVRNFIRPSAMFNAHERRSLLERMFRAAPSYQPDRFERGALQPLATPVSWRSALVLPINDGGELLGLLLLVSGDDNAFAAPISEELQPLRCLASLAIARRLYEAGRSTPDVRQAADEARQAATSTAERVRALEEALERSGAETRTRDEALDGKAREIEGLRRENAMHHEELREASRRLRALEEQNAGAASLLSDAYSKLAEAQMQLAEQQEALDFVRDAFDAVAGQTDPASLTRSFVAWFCEHFQADRCSLMRLDGDRSQLRIQAYRGLDPALAGRVRVPVGTGVSGWVAHHRQPVLVRERHDPAPVQPTGLDKYASDSFLSVPLVHRNRVLGVINLSNRRDGQPFEALDLERAQIAGNVLAMALSATERPAAPASAG